MEMKAANPFIEFSLRHSPAIERRIAEFYAKKKEQCLYPFMADQYPDIEEFSLRPAKRIRPLVLLAGYLGYGGSKRTIDDIIGISISLELLQSFFLIQDDIMDNARLRRGKKSLHLIAQEKFADYSHNRNIGRDIALCQADIALANALEIIADSPLNAAVRMRFLKLFASTGELTAWGQILDSMHSLSKNIKPEDDQAVQISTLKTAYYTICNPLIMGMLLAGKDREQEIEKVKNFAIPLGLAFQLRDDIIGVFGLSQKTGKSVESDITEGKLTFLVQTTVEKLRGNTLRQFLTTLAKEKKTAADIQFIRKQMTASGSHAIALHKVDDLLGAAREHLEQLHIQKTERDILAGLIDRIAEV